MISCRSPATATAAGTPTRHVVRATFSEPVSQEAPPPSCTAAADPTRVGVTSAADEHHAVPHTLWLAAWQTMEDVCLLIKQTWSNRSQVIARGCHPQDSVNRVGTSIVPEYAMLLVWCRDGRLPSDTLSLCDRLADSLPGAAGPHGSRASAPSGPGDSGHMGTAEAGRCGSTVDVQLSASCSLHVRLGSLPCELAAQ